MNSQIYMSGGEEFEDVFRCVQFDAALGGYRENGTDIPIINVFGHRTVHTLFAGHFNDVIIDIVFDEPFGRPWRLPRPKDMSSSGCRIIYSHDVPRANHQPLPMLFYH